MRKKFGWLQTVALAVIISMIAVGCASDPKNSGGGNGASDNNAGGAGTGEKVRIDYWGGWTGADLNTMQ